MGSIRTTWKRWGGGGTSITSFPALFSNWPWNETVTPDFTVTATEMLLLLYSCYHQSNLVAQRNYSFFLDPSKRPFLCRLQKYTIGSTNSFQFQIPAMMGSWVVAWEGASTSVANYQQPVLTLFLSLSLSLSSPSSLPLFYAQSSQAMIFPSLCTAFLVTTASSGSLSPPMLGGWRGCWLHLRWLRSKSVKTDSRTLRKTQRKVKLTASKQVGIL